jgi:hypothetical protein
MAKRYKPQAQPSAPVELVLGAVALLVWGVGQLWGAVRLLAATLAVAVVVGVAHTALTPVRDSTSTWAPSAGAAVVVMGSA